ncbi:unnamed protein product [Lactuca saligna]|uniref:Uncharacterized protein n=1 Tax=Lactuca saligna TaxID=75948 RepID=A0AA35ZML1_LACSI|nr:unnamed protein product [Lactuca saligna]
MSRLLHFLIKGLCIFSLALSALFFPFCVHLLFSFMVNLPGIVPSATEYRRLVISYGLSSLEGVEFPSPGSIISSPGKIGVYLKTQDVGIRFPLMDFQEEVLQKDGCSL